MRCVPGPLCAVLVAASFLAARPPVPRVLMIGNSLTGANDLPGMVERLASLNGTPVRTRAVAAPGFSLEDHWGSGQARPLIRSGGWSAVVLQQGPSALPESRVVLRRYTQLFAEEIRASGSKPALYMVWPSKTRTADFASVSESYRLAAADVEGLLLPAGDAWREAWTRDPALPLYSKDEFHPSPLGSYLAALVIVETLTSRAPTRHLPVAQALDAKRLRILQDSAHAALERQ
ncbi:MAG TPA: hypothetical protein VD833_25075 [Vicinamibacterales bacterium]|nr:hypothetical protein [Vicinamibacterales bacterium]